MFIPAWLGIRLGTVFATVLGLLSMIPLTFLAIARDVPAVGGRLGRAVRVPPAGRHAASSAGYGHDWLAMYIAFAFLLTWNVIAMEAAACYIGECRDPERDAKIAMNLEGATGCSSTRMIPISFIVVIGGKRSSANPALVDPNTIFSTFAGKVFGERRQARWTG